MSEQILEAKTVSGDNAGQECLSAAQIVSTFKEKLTVLDHYQRILSLMDWDLYTATPEKGYQEMSDTLAYFYKKHFALSTSDELFELLKQAAQPQVFDTLDEVMQYSVRTMLRDMKKERNIPPEFVAEYIAAENASRKAWEDAKNASDFSIFAPHLQKMIDLTIKRCGYTDPGKDPYEVLVDRYEEGMDCATIDRVFGELKEGLLPLLKKILAAPEPQTSIYNGHYDKDDQKKVQELLLRYIGYDFSAGTVGESMHPFTLGDSRNDQRLTNHYHEDDPISAMFSAIHEGGHAIFGQNNAPELDKTPAASCHYMGLHESQSRFYENILGRRMSFWKPVYGKIQALLPDLKDISLEEFVGEINHIRASYIRTQADEVTYCLHVILRYEMEQDIFRNHRKVEELPALWNQKMQELLGITPRNDAEGILQDMHWSDASFGYFPSYLLGSIYDGMFLEALEADLGPVDPILERGDILVITRWLNEKIHRYGNLRLPKEVIASVCGKELSARPLLKYFEEKYTKIYNL